MAIDRPHTEAHLRSRRHHHILLRLRHAPPHRPLGARCARIRPRSVPRRASEEVPQQEPLHLRSFQRRPPYLPRTTGKRIYFIPPSTPLTHPFTVRLQRDVLLPHPPHAGLLVDGSRLGCSAARDAPASFMAPSPWPSEQGEVVAQVPSDDVRSRGPLGQDARSKPLKARPSRPSPIGSNDMIFIFLFVK